MILGEVTANREAFVPVVVRSWRGEAFEFFCLVDTGFSGYLALPPQIVERLELPYLEQRPFRLADNTEAEFETYEAVRVWDNVERIVVVLASAGPPTIGMDLLYGYKISIEVIDGGEVTISAR